MRLKGSNNKCCTYGGVRNASKRTINSWPNFRNNIMRKLLHRQKLGLIGYENGFMYDNEAYLISIRKKLFRFSFDLERNYCYMFTSRFAPANVAINCELKLNLPLDLQSEVQRNRGS